MTPDFALTLSFDGIALLRRVPNGWARVGDVSLDATDLRGALADLRSEADTLSTDGGQVKLVIPNEQIKYLSFPDTGQTGDGLQHDIRLALDGATPYPVDDLSFDWSHNNGSVYVAAVANETLDEAEAFAKSHHFDPVSFVAIAPDGQFAGEVFFGRAASWMGTFPVRDTQTIVIVAAPPPAPVVLDDPFQPDLLADPEPDAAEPVVAEATPDTADAVLPDTPAVADSAADTEQTDEVSALAPGAADPDAALPLSPVANIPAEPVIPAPSVIPAEPPATPSFASIRASRDDDGTPPATPAPKIDASQPEAAGLPRFKIGGARKSTRDSDVTAPILQDDPAESPVERKGFSFFSRRKSEPRSEPSTPSPVAQAPTTGAKPPHDPEPARAAVARIAALRTGRKPDDTASNPAPVQDEQARMTVFGARTDPQIGGKPRFLGLMLTSALLIFLLAVAAWASVFLDEGVSRFFDRDDDTPSIARLPDVELLPLDGSVTAPRDEDENARFAALDVGDAADSADTGLSDIIPPPAALTPEEADARYAATGIWQRSPDAPATPTLTTLDNLYVASIDGRIQQFDAVALPSVETLRNDQTYLSQPNPSAPGVRFTLDDRGLVVATPEGTLNPEGVRVFSGLPPVVPPARPAPTQPDIEEPTGETATEVSPALQAFRPRLRPNDLIEGNERAQLAGRTLAELAALRPAARPDTLKAEEEVAQPAATEFAVAQSAAPVTRPRNFARVVEQARDTEQQQPEVTQVAAVAPRTVQPRIPSTANVARQATVSNAINLRRINLIGVYGKPSSRRALVRLSNGRYQKVQVGDRLDGGRVAVIGESELRYSKNGRNVVLDMPDG
ncbi:MAG: hypothetical protein ACSHXH_11365 [Marivita sp.]|uniref:hypothetical protein n=1 Tax=Marivita sp. TaxID=2003365 RepID=UPI003EF44C49